MQLQGPTTAGLRYSHTDGDGSVVVLLHGCHCAEGGTAKSRCTRSARRSVGGSRGARLTIRVLFEEGAPRLANPF